MTEKVLEDSQSHQPPLSDLKVNLDFSVTLDAAITVSGVTFILLG